jgi:hypothetical protein
MGYWGERLPHASPPVRGTLERTERPGGPCITYQNKAMENARAHQDVGTCGSPRKSSKIIFCAIAFLSPEEQFIKSSAVIR